MEVFLGVLVLILLGLGVTHPAWGLVAYLRRSARAGRRVRRGDALKHVHRPALPSGPPGLRRRPAPFDVPQIAARYEDWYRHEGRRADRLEKRLLGSLLGELRPFRSVVEVGAGTGHFTRRLGERSAGPVVGLDRSMEMLRHARPEGRVRYVLGDAAALPFRDRGLDLVAFVTTLEFVADPRRALAEALRVARRGVLVGALNRRSLLGRRLIRKAGPIWSSARLVTVRELRRLVREAGGGEAVRIVARTTLWPLWPRSLPLPWVGFIALAAAKPAESLEEVAP
jgi:SAM-dependent methyltransferase